MILPQFLQITCHICSYCVQILRKLYCNKLDDKGAFCFVLCMKSNALCQCYDRQAGKQACRNPYSARDLARSSSTALPHLAQAAFMLSALFVSQT